MRILQHLLFVSFVVETLSRPLRGQEQRSVTAQRTLKMHMQIQRLCNPSDSYIRLTTELLNRATGPTYYSQWSFNRGLSAITTGSLQNLENNPPTTLAVVQAQNGFSVASLSYNDAASKEKKELVYNLSVHPNLLQDGSDVTALTWIPPYIYNETTGSYDPVKDLNSYFFLLGSQAGNLWLVSWSVDTEKALIISSPIGSYGTASNGVADILYVPQNGILVVVDYSGYIRTYQIEYNQIDYGVGPTINFLKGYGNYEGSKSPSLPINLEGVFFDDDTTYIYACGLPSVSSESPGEMVWFELTEGNELSQIAVISTGKCYNILPTMHGMYYLANGNLVGFMEWAEEQDETTGEQVVMYGKLSEPPIPYMAFSSGNDTLTSLAFSPNKDNVAWYYNPKTEKFEVAYQNGALFIGVIKESINTGFLNDDNQYEDTAAGSVYLHEPCLAETDVWAENVALGPAYSLLADENMNVLVQNGNNGLMSMNVATAPGVATLATWIFNNAYSCSADSDNPYTKNVTISPLRLFLTGELKAYDTIKDSEVNYPNLLGAYLDSSAQAIAGVASPGGMALVNKI